MRRSNKILQTIVTNFTTFSNLLYSFSAPSFDALFIKWFTTKKFCLFLYGYISKMQFFSTDSVNNLYKHIRRYIPANPKLFSVFVSLLIYITQGVEYFSFILQNKNILTIRGIQDFLWMFQPITSEYYSYLSYFFSKV